MAYVFIGVDEGWTGWGVAHGVALGWPMGWPKFDKGWPWGGHGVAMGWGVANGVGGGQWGGSLFIVYFRS